MPNEAIEVKPVLIDTTRIEAIMTVEEVAKFDGIPTEAIPNVQKLIDRVEFMTARAKTHLLKCVDYIKENS